jgi:hypothetical protein
MTPLQSLKQILQEHLEVCQESEAYIEALSDAQYACELGESALNTIFQTWCMMPTDWGLETSSDIDYYRGCCYVHDQWNIIKEKEDECAN